MLESLPDYALAEIEKKWEDGPDRVNVDPVRNVFFFCPINPYSCARALYETKTQQFNTIAEIRERENKRIASLGRDGFVPLPQATRDWYSKFGAAFCLQNKLLGLESGLLFQLVSGKAIYVTNWFVHSRGRVIDYNEIFIIAYGVYEGDLVNEDKRVLDSLKDREFDEEMLERLRQKRGGGRELVSFTDVGQNILWVEDYDFKSNQEAVSSSQEPGRIEHAAVA